MSNAGFIVVILVIALLSPIKACAGGGLGGIGGGSITNPSLQMKIRPPTSWTYPDADAITTLAYFPGQSMSQSDATLRANGDLEAAIMSGLNTLQYPTTGVKITPSYSPPVVNDCVKVGSTPTTKGTKIGQAEGGTITKLITIQEATITVENCAARVYGTATEPAIIEDYPPIMASVKIEGLTISESQGELLAAKVSSYLMLNAKVDFAEEVTIS